MSINIIISLFLSLVLFFFFVQILNTPLINLVEWKNGNFIIPLHFCFSDVKLQVELLCVDPIYKYTDLEALFNNEKRYYFAACNKYCKGLPYSHFRDRALQFCKIQKLLLF